MRTWVIAKGDPAVYWCGWGWRTVQGFGGLDQAIRFSRRKDAERAARFQGLEGEAVEQELL